MRVGVALMRVVESLVILLCLDRSPGTKAAGDEKSVEALRRGSGRISVGLPWGSYSTCGLPVVFRPRLRVGRPTLQVFKVTKVGITFLVQLLAKGLSCLSTVGSGLVPKAMRGGRVCPLEGLLGAAVRSVQVGSGMAKVLVIPIHVCCVI